MLPTLGALIRSTPALASPTSALQSESPVVPGREEVSESHCSPNASCLGRTKRTEVRTPDSTCSQWRGIFRGSYFRASKTLVDNLLLEPPFTVTSNGGERREQDRRRRREQDTHKANKTINTDIASTWQYLLQF